MIGPRSQVFDAITERIKTYIDRVNDRSYHRATAYRGQATTNRDYMNAKLAMDRSIREAILFDWQPMETFPRGIDSADAMIVFEDTTTGKRFMAEAWADVNGTLYWPTDGDDTIHPDLRAVAWSYMPDSKALGGK